MNKAADRWPWMNNTLNKYSLGTHSTQYRDRGIEDIDPSHQEPFAEL